MLEGTNLRKYTTIELLILAVILVICGIMLCPVMKAQTLPIAGDPVVVTMVARDSSGNVVYTRKAFVFFAGIDQYGIGDGLVATDRISIQRTMREQGERCNPVLPTNIRETCSVTLSYCGGAK